MGIRGEWKEAPFGAKTAITFIICYMFVLLASIFAIAPPVETDEPLPTPGPGEAYQIQVYPSWFTEHGIYKTQETRSIVPEGEVYKVYDPETGDWVISDDLGYWIECYRQWYLEVLNKSSISK